MADKDTISWDFIVEDKNNMESIRLGFKNNSDTITDVTIMPQSDLDTIHETVNEANNTAIAANTTAETASNNVTNIQTELEEKIKNIESNLQGQIDILTQFKNKWSVWSNIISNTNFQLMQKGDLLRLNVHIPSATYSAGKQKVIHTFDTTKYSGYLPPNRIVVLSEYNYIVVILKKNQLIVENRRSSNWTGVVNVTLYYEK